MRDFCKRPRATDWLLAATCLLGSASAAAQPVPAKLVAQVGQVPAGGDGSALATLSTPRTNGLGQPVMVGRLLSDTSYVWLNTGIVFLSTQDTAQSVRLGSSTSLNTCGASLDGRWVALPEVDAILTVYSSAGSLISEFQAAPGFPSPATISRLDRPTMSDAGQIHFRAEIDLNNSGFAGATALYTTADGTLANLQPVLKSGDDLGAGFVLNTYGVAEWYEVSHDAAHSIVRVRSATANGVAVDGALVARQGAANGLEGNWSAFDFVSVNSSGHYLFSGDSDAATIRDEFVAYDGDISVREGDVVGGVTLANPAEVFAISLNDKGSAAHLWRHNPGATRTLFHSCSPTDLTNSRKVATHSDELDFDGDGTADATLTKFDIATNLGPGVSMAEDGTIYTRVELSYGGAPVSALVGFPTTCCGDGALQTGEDCDDGGASATCNADCTTSVCGDGKTNAAANETCDDGATGSATCDVDCTAAACGDGVHNSLAGEACDEGGETATCNGDCQLSSCGDGHTNVSAGEDCDAAGVETGGCDIDCTFPKCGDGVPNAAAGEQCDTGVEDAVCNLNCTLARCGDSIVNLKANEECDDGNILPDDGCSSFCKREDAGTGGTAGTGGAAGSAGASPGGAAQGGSAGAAAGTAGGTAGSAGAAGAAGTGSSGDSGDGSGDDSGCGCRSAGAVRPGSAPGLLGLSVGLLGAAFIRRRQRR